MLEGNVLVAPRDSWTLKTKGIQIIYFSYPHRYPIKKNRIHTPLNESFDGDVT